MFKKILICSILIFMLAGCATVNLFKEPGVIEITNCNRWTKVGIALFTEFNDDGSPSDYVVLEEKLFGEGNLVVETEPGLYVITYYNEEAKVIDYDVVELNPGDYLNFYYDCGEIGEDGNV